MTQIMKKKSESIHGTEPISRTQRTYKQQLMLNILLLKYNTYLYSYKDILNIHKDFKKNTYKKHCINYIIF